jgi:hypothetical protein
MNITDADRFTFMNKLAEAIRAKNGLIVEQWENDFVSNFRTSSQGTRWFSERRALWADRLRMKYGGEPEINMPHPDDNVDHQPAKVQIPDADPGCCIYLVKRDSGRQTPCNEPAVWQLTNGFRYCQTCADKAIIGCKRMGKALHLVKI